MLTRTRAAFRYDANTVNSARSAMFRRGATNSIPRDGVKDPSSLFALFVGFHFSHGSPKKMGRATRALPARKYLLHLLVDRIQGAVRHIIDLVVRWKGFVLHELGHTVMLFRKASRLIESPLLT